MIWMDYSQHQNREGKECSEVLRQAEANTYAAMATFLRIDDPEILTFVSTFVDGLIVGQIYALSPSILQQGKLHAKMLTAYLQAQERTLPVDESMRQPSCIREC